MPNITFSALIADDSVLNLILLQDALEQLGATVTTAEDGAEALSLARQHTYAILFLDVQMPQMDGLEVCRQLRDEGHHTPVIAYSGSDATADIAHSLAAGMNDYLPKPFAPEELEAILAKWLSPAGTAGS